MENIVNWIVKNPYWTVAGLFATFLGLIIAIIMPIIQRRRKNLFFSYSTTPLVKEDITNINGIEILFKGNPVEQLSVSSVRIWNGGNIIITPDDFYKGHELTLQLQNDTSILGIDMLKQSEDTIECNLTCSSSTINFSFQAFEKKEYISFNIYHTGNADTELDLKGKIKEGKIVNKTVDIEKLTSFMMNGGYSSVMRSVILAVFTVILTLLFTFILRLQNKDDS